MRKPELQRKLNHRRRAIQEKLEASILRGLACEWEATLSLLAPELLEQVRLPSFRLTDSRKQLGAWSPEKREIIFSRDFVLSHAWDDVRDILRHEMAHQLATDLFGANDEPPHGHVFRKACRLLRANPGASGCYRPLSCRVETEAASSEDRLIRRVRKLMALAGSHNRNEAEAAMSKALILMEKYNIDALTRAERNGYESIFVGKPALRHFREAYHLANLIEDFYFVQGIWVSAFVLERGKMGRVLEISGTAPNLKIARYVHAFVSRFTDREWTQYNNDKNMNRSRKTDFAIGVIAGFRKKLASREPRKPSSRGPISRALAIYDDPAFKSYMKHRYPHIRHFSRGANRMDGDVMADGEKIGQNLVVSQGIEHDGKPGSRPLAITES